MPQIIFGEGNGMVGTDQGRVYRQNATYAGLSAIANTYVWNDTYNYTEKVLSGGVFTVQVGLYRWDTSPSAPTPLPANAVVTAAAFRCNPLATSNIDTRNFALGWVSWDGTSASDWNAAPTNDAHAGTSITTIGGVGGVPQDFTLANASTNVNRTGYTYLKAFISGADPTGSNVMNFAAIADATYLGPQLVVDYVLSSRLAPDAILAQTNLTGAVSTIQDDPDSPDANWLTAP